MKSEEKPFRKKVKKHTSNKLDLNETTSSEEKEKAPKENVFNTVVKPYMNYLGISKYNAIPIDYYTGANKLYIIETDYLETFVLKLYPNNSYKYQSSIEKHFIINIKNISKITSSINVSHEADDTLRQFLFLDRLPGANKKWDNLNADEKSTIVKEIGKILFKIHSYNSSRLVNEIAYGRISDTKESWDIYLRELISKKLEQMRKYEDDTSKILKFEKICESKLISLSTHRIVPSLLHGSISLNKSGYLRSLLFLGTKISGIVNFDNAIFGDKVFDLVQLHQQILSKDPNLEKDFFREYGKLKQEEKERLEFYKTVTVIPDLVRDLL